MDLAIAFRGQGRKNIMSKQDKDRCIWCGCTDTRQFSENPIVITCSKGHYWKFDDDETVTPLRLIPHSRAAAKFKQLNKQVRYEARMVRNAGIYPAPHLIGLEKFREALLNMIEKDEVYLFELPDGSVNYVIDFQLMEERYGKELQYSN